MFTLSMPFPFPTLVGPSSGSYQSIYLASLSYAFIKEKKKASKHPATPSSPWSAIHAADKLDL